MLGSYNSTTASNTKLLSSLLIRIIKTKITMKWNENAFSSFAMSHQSIWHLMLFCSKLHSSVYSFFTAMSNFKKHQHTVSQGCTHLLLQALKKGEKEKQQAVSIFVGSVYFKTAFTCLLRQPSLMDFVCKTSSMNSAARWIINCAAVEYVVCSHLFSHFHIQ